ncbi:16S rRNA (guanine(527)-N(7))-methyltransferase RsmG [Paratractidigestivibacter sp.]|uniref:16S rRNA (guanine(527)-N(7))-methyltransferase RsmG n=1 Tax=Paratractidigestivibacter sp. TaxID=2847316 RepID=UPI002AC9202B|nr:16S rRNA (guanine(527)-N(7))-methyltransferase RsmG [Paratractidigestivibacter sp.]
MEDADRLEHVSQLIEELQSIGIECSEDQAKAMVRHLELVTEKNKMINLTRIVALRDAVTLHLVDSLVPLRTKGFGPSEGLRFVDIGTGAGFPGIPLAIMTGMEGVFIDSVGKKVNAVNEFIDDLGLSNCKAMHIRAEELAIEQSESFDLVVARAVAQSNVLVEYASPLLKKSGYLILEKANIETLELQNLNYASRICGLTRVSRETCELPREMGHREVLIYQKTAKPKIKLPRNNGMAKHHPLIP